MSGTAEGHNGQVVFDGQFVTITRKGFLARATVGKGEKRIPLASVAAVQWKPAGAMVNGFIAFTVPGGNEGRSKFGSQSFDAAKDENAVMFTKKQQVAFEGLRQDVEAGIAARHAPQQYVQAAPTATVGDQLQQLAALRDSGVLTDEEFAGQKAKLLGT